ncbi:AAA family ATPase [Limosilactobacillus ingluviei]|uniref:AAA family ATPase n=1 Tax=Limosilactobacillus ingluviei TaxID=148604 RepID=UPI0024BA1A91|nr:AAA family ATPase [Limosilactobacillus ingluviei]
MPPIYLDRDQHLALLLRELGKPLSPYRTTLIYGVRGAGRTALLTDVINQLNQQKDWIVVDLSTKTEMLNTLIDTLNLALGTPLNQTLTKGGISLPGLGVEIKGDQEEQMATQVRLTQALSKLKKRKRKLLLAIDEVAPTKEVVQLAALYQSMIRQGYPVAMVMTGLPNQVSELQNNAVLTFLLRSGRIELAPLNLLDVQNRYQTAFAKGERQLSTALAQRLAVLTKGYAYAFQLLGYLLWETGVEVLDDQVLDQVLPTYRYQLYRNAYTKIYQELSPIDRQFILAMEQVNADEVAIGQIRQALQKPSNYIANYRRRLIDDQVIRPTKYGYVTFTLPLFGDFIRENQALLDLM